MQRKVKIDFNCPTTGEAESGVVGYWTGERDDWGMRAFAADDGRTLYLFDDEIMSEEEIDHASVLA